MSWNVSQWLQTSLVLGIVTDLFSENYKIFCFKPGVWFFVHVFFTIKCLGVRRFLFRWKCSCVFSVSILIVAVTHPAFRTFANEVFLWQQYDVMPFWCHSIWGQDGIFTIPSDQCFLDFVLCQTSPMRFISSLLELMLLFLPPSIPRCSRWLAALRSISEPKQSTISSRDFRTFNHHVRRIAIRYQTSCDEVAWLVGTAMFLLLELTRISWTSCLKVMLFYGRRTILISVFVRKKFA